MKLFALPLARRLNPAVDTTPLFYLHAQKLNSKPTINLDGSKASIPLITRATEKAAATWAGFGAAKAGHWKRRIYETGDKFMDRIEFEEWSLKAIDPALSPQPWSRLSNDEGEEAFRQSGRKKLERVELIYPSSILESGQLLAKLKEELAHREPFHKSAMKKCLLGAPLTFPFAIVPLVPNFPLFYVLWRAWSHWRAYKASQYLRELLSTSQVALKPSAALDKIYSAAHPPSTTRPNELLLTLDTVPHIVQEFNLNEEDAGALRRSVIQAEARLIKEISNMATSPATVNQPEKEKKP